MNELTDFDDPAPDVTSDERTLLRKAGASEELIQMCQATLSAIRRHDGKTPTGNTVLKETKKYLRGTDHVGPQLTEDNAEEFSQYGGHFYTAMWEGDLYRAYSRADYNNQAIMTHVFGVRRINDHRPSHADPITV
jgi:hypothetical protein